MTILPDAVLMLYKAYKGNNLAKEQMIFSLFKEIVIKKLDQGVLIDYEEIYSDAFHAVQAFIWHMSASNKYGTMDTDAKSFGEIE